MLDYAALNKAIDQSGMKRKAVAGKLGITEHTFINKASGKSEFKLSEIQALCELLGISPSQRQQIFFC